MNGIVVIGNSEEPTTAHTLVRARELGLALTFVELSTFVRQGTVDLHRLRLRSCGVDIELQRTRSVYHRLIFDPVYVRRSSPQKRMRFNLLTEVLRRAHYQGLTRLYNVPSRQDPNSSKIAQIIELRKFGFRTPASIATNSPEAARQFVRRGPAIYKSLSGDRSIVTRAPRAESKRYLRLKNAPTLFQEYVAGDDVRVHAVERTMIGELIRSSGVDYRYEPNNEHSSINVPQNVSQLILEYMRYHNLRFAGCDFRIDAATGEWVVLEVNTMPGYSGYDQRAGGAISTALFAAMTEGN